MCLTVLEMHLEFLEAWTVSCHYAAQILEMLLGLDGARTREENLPKIRRGKLIRFFAKIGVDFPLTLYYIIFMDDD